MAANQHHLPAQSWEKLSVNLRNHCNASSRNATENLQAAWLLLLSTYGGDSQAKCYLRMSGDNRALHLLSIKIDRLLTLAEHTANVQREYVAVDHTSGVDTMICCGPETEAREWLARHQTGACGPLELVLVVNFASVDLLFKRRPWRMQREDAIGRIETLKTIYSIVVEAPSSVLGDTSFLSEYDKTRIDNWNQPMPDPPLNMTIPSGFATKVAEQPTRPAVHAWDGMLSYIELDEGSSALARLLRSDSRSGTGGMVLFNMQKSKWALVAALAILKSGNAIVPIDPSWPKARLHQIVEITDASLAVVDEDTKGVLQSDTIKEIVVSPVSVVYQGRGSSETVCHPKDLAFVLFSSGSTGVPKGMLREHGAACTGSFAHAKAMHLDSSCRVLQFANHVFDVAMLDFFTTLLVGGCVCIPSEADRKNDLAGFIQRSKSSWALLTPTVAEILDPATVDSLRFVTLGGEAMNAALLQKWLPFCRVGINYGSAEVDVTHTCDVVDPTDISNVGQRLPSCVSYIVDPQSPAIVLPVGAIGELVISGSTMAREYLKAPAKTAEVFIEIPQSWHEYGIIKTRRLPGMHRMYRMGDLCRQRSDGRLIFVGRKDFQVKVNSQKVELGDIESKLLQHPSVTQCVVVFPVRGPLAKRLVAIVQSIDDGSQTSRHARAAALTGTGSVLSFQTMTEFLSHRLPPYMLPTVLVRMERLPCTPAMKIDRQRLRAWLVEEDLCSAPPGEVLHMSTALNGPLLSAEDAHAMTISRVIADIVAVRPSAVWTSIYGHDHRLADIGINSAQMMRMASAIKKEFGKIMWVQMLGEPEMTVRRLAALLEGSGEAKDVHQATVDVDGGQKEALKARVMTLSQSVLGLGARNATPPTPSRPCPPRHVFLTGATGYLGVHVLGRLLQCRHVASVTVLLRGGSAPKALERLTAALTDAGLSRGEEQTTLRAWPGDLSRPRLGLSGDHWSELTASGWGGIDSILHCGAVVDWRQSYADLQAANVTSTVELLSIAVAAPGIQTFLFVSGGRYPELKSANEHARYTEASRGTGYAQTKFVAERVVENVQHVGRHTSVHIVSPAYLIGNQGPGRANQDDYIWRIVWASVRVGAYNADEDDQWLFVAEVGQVAERVVASIQPQHSRDASPTLRVLDGVSVRRFWDIISAVLPAPLSPETGDTWLHKVQSDMEVDGHHLLWPLADVLDMSSGMLTQRRCPAADVSEDSATSDGIELAVRQNVRYLQTVGFFDNNKIAA